jgi:PTH1 family peptidyl-tRNA hydrolase
VSGERVLLVGLGNPGTGYAAHRHNVGFMAVDAIAGRERLVWRRSRFHGEVAAGSLGGREALLLKPATFMNESGRSVAAAARFYKVPAEDVFVFHDELDLPSGRLRVKRGGGAAGHNGLRSIDALFGNGYWRVRLGIGHPGDKRHVLGHVLRDFDETDRQWLDPLLAAIAEHAALLVAGDPAAFASRVALALAPPKPRVARPSPQPSPQGEGEDAPPRASSQSSPSGEGASESEGVRGRPPGSKDEP